MNSANFLQLFGIIYLAIGLGMLLNPKYYHKILKDYLENEALVYLSGILALFIGYIMIVYCKTYTSGWPVIILIIGWLALIKGIIILLLPKFQASMKKAFLKKKETITLWGVIITIIGIVLSYAGFFVL